MKKPRIKLVFGVFLTLSLLGVISLGALSWVVGSRLAAPEPGAVGELPADLPGEEVTFESASGSTIHGWLIPGTANRGVVVLMHGVHGNRRSMLGRARMLHEAGYASLLFDFQGMGESPGEGKTFGHLEGMDAQAAVQFARERFPGEPVGVIGVSLGGAAALLATPPLDVDALVLELVYSTIEQALINRLEMRLGQAGAIAAPLLTWQMPLRLGIELNRLRPIDHISDARAPVLIVAGEADRHTTLDESKQLFAAAREPKQLWVVPNARHEDIQAIHPEEYERMVLQFLEKWMKQ